MKKCNSLCPFKAKKFCPKICHFAHCYAIFRILKTHLFCVFFSFSFLRRQKRLKSKKSVYVGMFYGIIIPV